MLFWICKDISEISPLTLWKPPATCPLSVLSLTTVVHCKGVQLQNAEKGEIEKNSTASIILLAWRLCQLWTTHCFGETEAFKVHFHYLRPSAIKWTARFPHPAAFSHQREMQLKGGAVLQEDQLNQGIGYYLTSLYVACTVKKHIMCISFTLYCSFCFPSI